ncbi:MAG: sulfoxide reductase heme-binding subunit YedZ [Burkholderiaceae bacterium]|nr:sulfoxide reductase heme-binding subunit YedZ [Burkholderiaceae bacterium]
MTGPPRDAAPSARLLPRVPAALDARRFAAVRALLFALACVPLARVFYLAATDALGANPVEFVVRSLGTWALVLLCATLAVTPLRWLTHWAWLARLRRMLGLFCFAYATLHVFAYVGLDQWFDGTALAADILKRPYITAGVAAYLLLLPLATTSCDAMVRRLGGRRWQRLHRLVYAVALLALLHYAWQKAAKNDFATVAVYATIIGALLGVRLLRWLWPRRLPAPALTATGIRRGTRR